MDSSREQLRETAIRLRREGLSRRQIRERIDVSDNTLGIWLRGVPAPEWTRRPRAKDDLRAKARELRLAGWNYPRIAEELSVSKSSVSLWVRDLPHPELEPGGRALAQVAAAAWWREERYRRYVQRQRELFAAAKTVGSVSDRELLIAGRLPTGRKEASRSRGIIRNGCRSVTAIPT